MAARRRGGGGGAGAGGGGQDGDEADSGDARPADGSEAEATGNVTAVGAIADGSSGVASFPVTVTFESTSDELTVGSTVDVEIVYERIDDAIQVPVQAVTSEGGASTVVVRTDDGDETRTVETGVTSGGMVQVTSGLEAGEPSEVTVQTGAVGQTWTEITDGLDVGQTVVLADLDAPLPRSATDTQDTGGFGGPGGFGGFGGGGPGL